MTTPAAKHFNHPIKIPNLSHHAYYLVGGESARAELVNVLAKQHKIKTHGNLDFSERKYENFTIDDARELKTSAEMRPTGSATGGATNALDVKKFFVIQIDNITFEAQNSLLKLLEEPADYVHFLIVVPSAHLLLPTVKSRMSLIATGETGMSGASDKIALEAETFLKATVAKRLDYIKKLATDITDEKRSKQDVVDLLNAIESLVYMKSGTRGNQRSLEAIEKARNYMNDRGASLKMLLEFVALNI